jgi:beta-N-acetylhexosaminidase
MLKRHISLLLLIALLLSISPSVFVRAESARQQDPIVLRAEQMLSRMSPEERVGQLFMVAFKGSSAQQDSQIYDLIVHHHVGGVMLLAGNDNFVQAPDTVSSAYSLISQLQNAEWAASQNPSENTSAGTPSPEPTITASPTSNYIPLFIGAEQNGDGYPNDQILSGLTELPSLMAIGATWDPTLAEQVGLVAGQELSALGFNFFVGPSLDVLESPEATLGNGLDANVFGGDPYWVGTLGSAYITGVHTGSEGKMVVIADHFPGRGSADRPAGQEPPTVRKSLEQLKQIELAPFFSVTGDSQNPQSTVDGLLVSHIRYQGFQGNIRSTTRPVSFDPQALSQILSLPAFSRWHNAGGLMVSDDLGSPTVRNFYGPGQQPFQARLVARDAFLAGNDLLYMGNIQSSDTPDNYSTLLQTFDFFTQKYGEDTAFAQRVDAAVTHILTLKYKLYNYFSPSLVIPQESGLALVGQSQSQAVTSEVARQSATLINPDNNLDLETVLPNPPGMHDQLVFLTDTRTQGQCSKCKQEPMLPVDALQKVIMRLYGPQSGGQVLAGRMISYTFDSLAAILPGGSGNVSLEGSLNQATWVVINMLDAEPGETQTNLLRRFLSERQDLLRDKHVIVFAFNAPYFLDSTDISEITAYYGLYSKSAPFIEVAARLLFRELTPAGFLPVSVDGIGYDLLSQTSPDPNQVITLSIDLPTSSSPAGTVTPQPTPTPFFSAGQTHSIHTGIILDHNGHPVPDGTGVQFIIRLSGTNGIFQQISAVTSHGVASAPFNIPQSGFFQISATSDPAMTSLILQLDVTNTGGFSISLATATEISQPTMTPTITPTATPVVTSPLKLGYPGFGGWASMVFVLGAMGLFAYWVGDRFASRRWGVRSSMCVILGGLLTYSYLAMRLPGATVFLRENGWPGIVEMVMAGALIGAVGAFLWFRVVRESKTQSG